MKALVVALMCLFMIAATGATAGLFHRKKMSRRAIARAPKFIFINKGSEEIELGNISDKEYVVFSFDFTNAGKTPLIIKNAFGECGCTLPEIPKEPVAPGAKGSIKVTFNPTGKAGPFRKAIFIESNALPNGADGKYTVHIEGAVVPGLPLDHPPRNK